MESVSFWCQLAVGVDDVAMGVEGQQALVGMLTDAVDEQTAVRPVQAVSLLTGGG